MSDRLTVRFQIYEDNIPDGQPLWATPKIGILQRLDLTFEHDHWHVSGGPDGMRRFHGHGEHMAAAVLDWLADRLALNPAPDPQETP